MDAKDSCITSITKYRFQILPRSHFFPCLPVMNGDFRNIYDDINWLCTSLSPVGSPTLHELSFKFLCFALQIWGTGLSKTGSDTLGFKENISNSFLAQTYFFVIEKNNVCLEILVKILRTSGPNLFQKKWTSFLF